MSFATIGDALNARVHALLVRQSNSFTEKRHYKEKLAKIGVLVVRETEPNTFGRASFEAADCAVLIEGAANANERDALLKLGVETGRPVFFLNEKQSHVSWERLAEFVKRKGTALSNVVPLAPKSEPRGRTSEEPYIETLLKREEAILTNGPTVDPLAELRETHAREVERLKKEIDEATEVAGVYAKEKDDANRAAQIYASERDAASRREEEAREACADYARQLAEILTPLEASSVDEAKEAIKALQGTSAKRMGGVTGAAERWKREYKKRAEDAEARAEALEAELTTLRKKKGAGIDEAQLRALFNALAVKALGVDDVVRVVLRLTKGEL